MDRFPSIKDWEIREENLEGLRAGLFSLSPRWYRHSSYVIVKDPDGHAWISPEPNATIEWYKPFEEFPEILMRFIEVSSKINEIHDDEAGQQAKALLPFVKQYGLLGSFWLNVAEIVPQIEAGNLAHWIVLLKNPIVTKDLKTLWSVSYDDYARSFFPGMTAPYPLQQYSSKEEERRFLAHCADFINDLTRSYEFHSIGHHIEKVKDFQSCNPNVSSPYNDPNISWSQYLEMEIDCLGVSLIHEDGRYQLAWRFRTLLDALQIMWVNNVAGTMGQQVKVCALEGCNRPHLRKGLYCCVKHTNLAAQRAKRKRDKETEKPNEGS